jgi:hypothetical protein
MNGIVHQASRASRERDSLSRVNPLSEPGLFPGNADSLAGQPPMARLSNLFLTSVIFGSTQMTCDSESRAPGRLPHPPTP